MRQPDKQKQGKRKRFDRGIDKRKQIRQATIQVQAKKVRIYIKAAGIRGLKGYRFVTGLGGGDSMRSGLN